MEQLVFAFFDTPSAAGFPKIFDLRLNDDESFVVTLAGFLLFIFFFIPFKLP